MANKKKTAKKQSRASKRSATALLDEDAPDVEELDGADADDIEPIEDDVPTLNEALGLQEDDDEPVSIVDLSEDEQEAVISSLRAEGREEDADIAQSRVNAARRRQGSRTAELVRLEPDEDEEGIPIKGVQKTFSPPFNDLSIRKWAGKVLGGGKYEIIYYGANHEWRGRERFTVPGLPNPWRKQKQLIDDSESAVKRETEQSMGAATQRELELEDKLNQLTAAIARQERQREEDDKERRHREEIARLEAKIEASGAKKESNFPELITALGVAAAPLVEAMSARMSSQEDRRGEAKEMAAAMQKAASDSRASMMEIFALQNSGKSGMDSVMEKMLIPIMMERLKPQQDPQTFAFDMLRKVIPQAVSSSLEMAAVAQSGGGNKDDNMLERVFEMVGPLMERVMPGGAGGAGAQPMVPQGAMPMQPGYGMAPQAPQQQMSPQQVAYLAQLQAQRAQALAQAQAGMRPPVPTQPQVAQQIPGQYPYTQAQATPQYPTATPGAQPMAGQPQSQPQMQPQPTFPQPQPSGIGPTPGMQPGQQVGGPASSASGQLPQAPPAQQYTAPPAPHPDTNPAAAHINPALFVLVRNFINAGKTGDELAETVDDQIESVKTGQQAGAPLLSEQAVGYMEQFPPNLIINKLWDACPEEAMVHFRIPGTTQIAPNVEEFVMEFLHFYFDDDEDEAALEGAVSLDGVAPVTSAPAEATTESQPAPEIPAQGA